MTLRIIPAPSLAGYPTRSSFEGLLQSRGYSCTPANASGGSILRPPGGAIVWKVADDPSTREFADMLRSGPAFGALPRIFAMTDPMITAYTGLAMEELAPFPGHAAWTDWYEQSYRATKGSPPGDPFRVLPAITHLRIEASSRGVLLDLQAKNILLRRHTQEIVFFDPFS